ncbi:MAG: HAMP domain-containing sensor histidine kinase [Clostridium sp.]|uniref:HAMP domain-containing sensor histidine kinase n=1 Tax=Clostridium sp. TaxID=1506 RepID=UPI002911DF52|nr:HAMP domain-containing sensor histidine kinase [Clostridium sp.]MDU5109929.1 HAMP domain-containing sensor histidine kinase [Clostridium sp.]
MNKISKRIIKYMVLINIVVILVGFILTSSILPKIYINNEYSDLEIASEYVLEAAKNNTVIDLTDIYAVLVNDGSVKNMCRTMSRGQGSGGNNSSGGMGHMGKMGMMNHSKNIDFASVKNKDIFKDNDGNTYIGIKKSSDYGDIVVYKDYEEIRSLIKSVNLIIVAIFIFSLVLSIIIAFYLGEKFTKPIIALQKRADNISKGIYENTLEVTTNDEIEELNKSINKMSEELKIKDTMQREFISNVSHDLKTPLSVIRANSEVIKDGLVEGEEVVDYATNIIEEVDILSSLVGEILVLSKLRENKSTIHLADTNLVDFINESYYKLKNIVSINKNLVLKNELEDSNYYIKIDSNYLYRVLTNFITNAIKYSKSTRDEITFGIKNIDNGVEIYVRDYGIGIDEESLKNIWDRYYKGDKSGGMGLGLAISKEIIMAHGFLYGVRSKLGEGSEFYFIVPNKLIKKI